MHRNPWFTLIVGLMIGLALGYVLAERQPVPPSRALAAARPPARPQGQGMPEGHPPVQGTAQQAADSLDQQAQRLKDMLAEKPDDPQLQTALGNLYFDAGRWAEARDAYEGAMKGRSDNPDLITDLAVAYRNLRQPERSLELLDRAVLIKPDHWQAWYNTVVVLHYDLKRHDQAVAALKRLQEIRRNGGPVPDLTGLERDVLGSSS
jgi:predicted Zn-dependent protease